MESESSDFPSKGLVYPNKNPDKKHRPVLFLYNKERDKYDMLVIDPMAVPGKIHEGCKSGKIHERHREDRTD